MDHINLTTSDFSITDFELTKKKVLNWVKRFDTFCFLDNHQYQIAPHTIECLVAAGVNRELRSRAGNALTALQAFIGKNNGWLFGHLAYDLKNEIEELSSSHPDHIQFPDLYFFEPQVVIRLSATEIKIEASDPTSVYAGICSVTPDDAPVTYAQIDINSRISRDEYLDIIKRLKQHIGRGDCYEINFCQEFFAEKISIDPIVLYQKLSALSPNPFSALYRVADQWLVCASPERFLKKQGDKLLSQPIKGTSKRVPGDPDADNSEMENLYESNKDRSENVMVVDIVRNDLGKICREGTVRVEELFGIYSFPQVHQMISTVSGFVDSEVIFSDIIRATFPMGSMTGAPKKRVMELIEDYEKSRRGLFSGALGYIAPGGDFDFNVVIRSILYNAATQYLSFPAGSGITYYSDPVKEWEECQWKAAAIRNILEEKAKP